MCKTNRNTTFLVEMETFGKIILNSRHDGLNKFKKYKKVHVNAKIFATLGNDFDQFFHYRGMSKILLGLKLSDSQPKGDVINLFCKR